MTTEKTPTGFILNTKAGGGIPGDVKSSIRQWADNRGIPAFIHLTDGREDFLPIVDQLMDSGAERIVAAGGDGTIAQTASALLGREVPLGILPLGTANGVARELGIPLELESSLHLLAAGGSVRTLDAIDAKDRLLLISLSVGLSASAVDQLDTDFKGRFGQLAYLLTGVREAFGVEAHPLTLILDDERVTDSFVEVAILNMGILGLPDPLLGGSLLPDDGQLRLIALKERDPTEASLEALIAGGAGLEEFVLVRDVTRVEIQGDPALAVQGDGDVIGNLPVRAEILAGKIPIIVPEESTSGATA